MIAGSSSFVPDTASDNTHCILSTFTSGFATGIHAGVELSVDGAAGVVGDVVTCGPVATRTPDESPCSSFLNSAREVRISARALLYDTFFSFSEILRKC